MAPSQLDASRADAERWVVHKFGGTSVGSADCMRRCLDILRPHLADQRVAVVVSAMGGKPKVTDLLLDLVHAAAGGRKDEVEAKMQQIRLKHQVCVGDILKSSPERRERVLKLIESDLSDISDLLRAVLLMKTAHEQMLELVSGYGEIWSASVLVETMQEEGLPFALLNARDVLFVSEEETVGTKVHWDESSRSLQLRLASAPRHLVVTGYIASTLEGVATTLKRDGSDFSASIFGKLLRAEAITIWTDVSGVYSADPRRVPEATIIPEVSYCEAIELAYFGAKVIHPKTMAPAIDAQIPIFIRNTFDPAHEGTRICLAPGLQQARRASVCGFTTIDGLSLLNLEGTGIIGVPGIAHRLFGALKAAHVPVLFIAQASSEHNICFATLSTQAAKARSALEEAFFYEQRCGFVSALRLLEGCSIIAAVGDGMSSVPGVAGLFFNALGGASINILSISMGCDERNISAVVYTREATRALRAVHSAFWLSSLNVNVAVVGTGRVGSALLQALLEQAQVLEQRFGIKIALRCVSNSRKMLVGDDLADALKRKMRVFSGGAGGAGGAGTAGGEAGIRRSHSNVSLRDLEVVMTGEGEGQQPADLDALVTHLRGAAGPHAIIVDATTSAAVAALHPLWLRAGCHVVTANKRALASGLDLYNAVFSAARAANRMYMSEVTIGASLPVRTTLNDILCSGDAVRSIVGLMTVSTAVVLAYIEDGMTFSEAVAETYARGLFEDDPFLDLEGADAAAKLLILGRELGFALRLEDIEVEPLALRRDVDEGGLTREALAAGKCFAEEDERLKGRIARARERDCVLRYVQRIDCVPPAELGHRGGLSAVKATVRLEEVPRDSGLATVQGPVYHFAFHTARYSQNPLIVQGPLSDPANTASGIVGDILRIARSIGAKDRGPETLS